MQRGRPAPAIDLAPAERATLAAWAVDPSQAPELAQRARIVLCCSEGLTNMAVARRLDVTRETAGKWRRRFLDGGVQGLLDEPRPGAPSTICDGDVERVRQLAEIQPPAGALWSTRGMARSASLSQTAVSRIWKIFTLEPHTSLPRHFPKEGLHLERVRSLAGLYLEPPLRALALAYDPTVPVEKPSERDSPASAEDPSRTRAERVLDAHASLYARLDAQVRKVNGHHPRGRNSSDFLTFLTGVERVIPAGCHAHLVLGSLSISKLPEVESWLRARDHFQPHFIPTSGAWLKLVERWANALGQRPGSWERRDNPMDARISDLERAVEAYLALENGIGQPFRWFHRVPQRAASLAT